MRPIGKRDLILAGFVLIFIPSLFGKIGEQFGLYTTTESLLDAQMISLPVVWFIWLYLLSLYAKQKSKWWYWIAKNLMYASGILGVLVVTFGVVQLFFEVAV